MLLHLIPDAKASDNRPMAADLQRRVPVMAAIFVVILVVIAGAVLITGGRESTSCPRGARANVVQPKEGPGRPPVCPDAGN
jgi:hypothetical protein